MGSKISRVVQAHVKADASVAPTTSTRDHHDINGTNGQLRQDPAPQLPQPVCTLNRGPTLTHSLARDDINVHISTPTASPMNSQRRHSTSNTRQRLELLNSFEQYLAERRIMNIDYEDTSVPLPSHPNPAPAPAPAHVEPVPQCIICCVDLPKDGDKEIIKPCRPCQSVYCTSCVRNMFIDACKDSSRMPPRCCAPINIHHAKPYLSVEQATLFRSKYEEWCTSNPIYCPVPVCSAFIPDRLTPQHVRIKSKQRVDSGIGTPKSASFACPTCDADICADCRQQAHPGSMCSIHEFGLDAETAELLKIWGYKKCPNCGHGVKRMYGCAHMECRCGAHFCWHCLENINECDGGCHNENDDDDDEYDSDGEPDDEVLDQATEAVSQAEAKEYADTTPPQPNPRPRNLDGGGHRYWENADLDFGDEPQGGSEELIWDCEHAFHTYTIPLATALTSHSTEMECVKCWSTIHPTIDTPAASGSVKEKVIPASSRRATRSGVRGNRGRGRGRGRYATPRGLFRANATIGTAPHLTTTLLSQSQPTRDISPMEDVQFSQRITDTRGIVISTTPTQPLRRASLESPDSVLQHRVHKHAQTSSIFDSTPPTFSLAHECEYCYLLVCDKCKTDTLEVQEAIQTRKAEEEVREYEMRERERERVQQEATVQDPTSQEANQQEAMAQQQPEQAVAQEDDDEVDDPCCVMFD
jgi:hypothetical protein